MSKSCLICGKPGIPDDSEPYHIPCSQAMFGTDHPPLVPFGIDELKSLAYKIITEKTTMTGVQKKLSLTIREQGKQSKLTFIGMWGDYILKPQVEAYNQLPENEFLTLCLANLFRIETVPHALLPLASGEMSYVTRRIDRRDNGKIHMEDMAQIIGRMTEDKYKGSAEQIGKKILLHCENRILDALRFYELILFCYLTGNGDMHLKNFSLIRKGDTLHFAPAYDLLNTRLVITEKEDPDESALSINGKRRKLKLNDFAALGRSLELNEKQLSNIHKRYLKTRVEALQMIEKSLLSDPLKQEYQALFLKRLDILKMS
jgi:serine/threonine-protein kinase HipA